MNIILLIAFFSYKLKRAALRYNIGICLQTSCIVQASSPYLAGVYSDIKIACQDVINWIKPGEKIIADNGYCGYSVFAYPSTGRRDNLLLCRVLARYENINQRIRHFTILINRYIGNLVFYSTIMHAIFNIA